MSALTKIFVVLLVIMSLMLSAGLIVFVNRQENFQQDYKKALQEKTLAEANAKAIVAQVNLTDAEKDKALAELHTQLQAVKVDLATRDGQIVQLNGQLADKESANTQLTASQTSLSAALQVAQNDIKARQEAYNALYADNDKVQKQVVEEGNRITELTNANDILTRQSRYMQEQVAQLQQQNTQLNDLIKKYNISPTGQALTSDNVINHTPSVNINGVVRDFKSIHGVPFATISLGSADAVTKGMKFNVIDPTANKFLGYFTVDTVGVHEATGRLDGPGVDSVRPNISEVRTQL